MVTNSNMDALKQLITSGPYAHTHIVFDEFNFKHAGLGRKPISAEEALGLLCCEGKFQLRVLYGTVEIPPIPRIFTTNLDPMDIFPPGSSQDQTDAFRSRFRAVHVPVPLFA